VRESGKSGFENLTGRPAKVTSARPLGCRAIAKKTTRELLASGSTAVGERGWEGVYLGRGRNSPEYLVWVPALGRVLNRSDVDFEVNRFPLRDASDIPASVGVEVFDDLLEFGLPTFDGGCGGDQDPGGSNPPTGGGGDGDDPQSGVGGDDVDDDVTEIAPATEDDDPPTEGGGDAATEDDDEDDATDTSATGRPRRDTRPAPDPNDLSAWGSRHQSALAAECHDMLAEMGAADAHDISEDCNAPDGTVLLVERDDMFFLACRAGSAFATNTITVQEALNGPRASEHREAMGKEWDGQTKRFGSFSLIPISDKPKGVTLLDLLWVLAEKTGRVDGQDNVFIKAKARLCARGDRQVAGRDFDPFKISSPTLRYSSYRLLGALAAIFGRPLRSSDGVQAYLQVPEKPISEGIPARIPKISRTYTESGEELIALIRRSVYGLRNAGNEWNHEINGFLTAARPEGLGFTRCTADPCMYAWREGGDWAYLGLYTDNAVHLESSDEVYAYVMTRLQAKYEWVEEGIIDQNLGLRVIQDIAAGTVVFQQEGYIAALAEEYAEHVSGRRVSTPARAHLEYRVRDALETRTNPRDPALVKVYQRLVGSLIFAAIATRPDIAYAVGMLSRAMSCPTEEVMCDAYRVLNYLNQTKTLGLTYSRSTYFSARTGTPMLRRDTAAGELSLVYAQTRVLFDEGSSDSDFAVGPSISGWELRMAGAAILWGSKRQSTTEVSTTGAEIVAGSMAAADHCWGQNLMEEFGLPQPGPTVMYMDNSGAVALAHDPQAFRKVKHIERRHHFLRECVEDGRMTVKKIGTDFNVSDIFTKPLEPKKFNVFRAALMNLPLESLA